MSSSIRRTARRVARTRPATSLLRQLDRWNGLLTICYHRIGNGATSDFDRAIWSATADELDADLGELQKHVEPVAPAELADALSARAGRRVLITFDDGFRDNHDAALPVLQAHGLQAVFFLATGFIDRPRVPWWDEIAWMVHRSDREALNRGPYMEDGLALPRDDREPAIAALIERYKALPAESGAAMLDWLAAETATGRCADEDGEAMWMTWDMVKALRDAGMTIGAHTVNHHVLTRLPEDAQREEIAGSRQRLSAELGELPELFSYPVGLNEAYDEVTERLVQSEGFTHAFSLQGGWARPGHRNPFDVPRISAGWRDDHVQLRSALASPRLFARH